MTSGKLDATATTFGLIAHFLNDEKALEWLGFAQQSSYRRQGLRSIPMLTHSINRGEHPV